MGAQTCAADHLIGKTLDGRYLIETKIATGGFGTVYRARSVDGTQQFAIKVLLAQHSNDPSVSARFRREAVAMSSLANRHTVTTYELGEDFDTGAQFIVMELLSGESLYDRFAACGALHWRVVLSIVRQACESLAEAHALGIVHRDLKPANIFLTQSPTPDFVKLLDFGIAKILQGSNMHDGTDLTRIGQAIGTLEYMSPEQLIGGALDNRTDIFTLGVVAYEMICGRRPFADVTGATGLVTALMTRRPPPPSTLVKHLPPSLDGVLLRCLERDAQDRYADVRELAHEIDRMLATVDLFSTQRQWGNRSQPVQPMFADDQEDELTQVDAPIPFDVVKPPSKPPVDERRVMPRAAVVEVPVADAIAPHLAAAVRAPLVAQKVEPVRDLGRAPTVGGLASRSWRAQGTGVPFAPTSTFDNFADYQLPSDERTGARPLYASPWAVGTEATSEAPTRLAIGSSPVIEERPVLAAMPLAPVLQPGGTVSSEPEIEAAPRRTGVLGLALWAVVLTGVGLGIGAVIATFAA